MKQFFALFLFTFSFLANAQVKELALTKTQLEEINITFENYLSEVQASEKDWDKITSYTYAPLFELFTKKDIELKLKQAFDNTIYYTTFDKMKVIKENGSFSFNDVIYSKINYDNHFAFHFKEDKDQTLEEKELYINFLTETFKNQFKDMEVVRDGDAILFSGEKIIIAVYDSNVGSWKMLEYLENNEIYYGMFLPKEVAEYLGKS
ncbi:MAG: hypothetical protein QM499_11250 [Flavobacteriaceae bacterium]